MRKSQLKKELMALIDPSSQFEVEKVERYLNLVDLYKGLDKSIKANGYVTETVNGNQRFIKVNPAVSEKVKLNQALIKHGEFFEKRRLELSAEKENGTRFNPDDFLE